MWNKVANGVLCYTLHTLLLGRSLPLEYRSLRPIPVNSLAFLWNSSFCHCTLSCVCCWHVYCSVLWYPVIDPANWSLLSFQNLKLFVYCIKIRFLPQRKFIGEIKSWLKSGNACYHSVQNLPSSSLLFKYINIKIHLSFCQSFCMVVKLGRSCRGRNVGRRYSWIGCWGRYLGLRGTR